MEPEEQPTERLTDQPEEQPDEPRVPALQRWRIPVTAGIAAACR